MLRNSMIRTSAKRRTSNNFKTAVLALNPYTYWRFAETSGTTVVDEKGVKNATLAGSYTRNVTSLLPSMTDPAVDFGNKTGYATVPNSGQFGFIGWTYYSVFKLRTIPVSGTLSTIFHIGDQTISGNLGLAVYVTDTGTVALSWLNGGWQSAGAGVITAGQTTHVAIALLTATSAVIYINGTSFPVTLPNAIPATIYPMTIGAVKGNGYVHLNDGIRDDTFTINRVLTATEISNLYASR